MAVYGSGRYDAGLQGAATQLEKRLRGQATELGRFYGQERFRRGSADAGRQFKDRFPKIGSSFQRRNLWDSGMRKQAQRKEANEFMRARNRARFDYGVEDLNYLIGGAMDNAGFQNQMLGIRENLGRQRATEFDPFAALRG